MRENARVKAKRLLVESRVMLRSVAPGRVNALVRGDSGCLREVTYDGHWFCPCPARGTCSHIMAVESVVLVTDRATTNQELLSVAL